MTDKQDGRNKKGGKRKGAGRPPRFKDSVNKQIRFERAAIKTIKDAGYEISEFIRVATDQRIKELGLDD